MRGLESKDQSRRSAFDLCSKGEAKVSIKGVKFVKGCLHRFLDFWRWGQRRMWVVISGKERGRERNGTRNMGHRSKMMREGAIRATPREGQEPKFKVKSEPRRSTTWSRPFSKNKSSKTPNRNPPTRYPVSAPGDPVIR